MSCHVWLSGTPGCALEPRYRYGARVCANMACVVAREVSGLYFSTRENYPPKTLFFSYSNYSMINH